MYEEEEEPEFEMTLAGRRPYAESEEEGEE